MRAQKLVFFRLQSTSEQRLLKLQLSLGRGRGPQRRQQGILGVLERPVGVREELVIAQQGLDVHAEHATGPSVIWRHACQQQAFAGTAHAFSRVQQHTRSAGVDFIHALEVDHDELGALREMFDLLVGCLRRPEEQRAVEFHQGDLASVRTQQSGVSRGADLA
jgi:hypothetical protein